MSDMSIHKMQNAKDALDHFVAEMAQMKPMPPEFSKVVDKLFDEIIDESGTAL